MENKMRLDPVPAKDNQLLDELRNLDKNQLFELTLEKIGGFGNFQKLLWLIGIFCCFMRKSVLIKRRLILEPIL